MRMRMRLRVVWPARLVWTLGGTTPSFTFDASAAVSGPRAFA